MPKAEFNNGQPIGHEDEPHFQGQGSDGALQCDVHGWMNAYVGVLDHPSFAVSRTTARSKSRACHLAPTRSKLARETRRNDAECHDRREGIEGSQLLVRRREGGGGLNRQEGQEAPALPPLPPFLP
jgi:hypothetical protein